MAAEPIPIRRPAPDPERKRLEELVEELAALVAHENTLRARAESAANELAVIVTRAMADLDKANADREQAEEVAAEMAVLLAREQAERESAEDRAIEATARAHVESEWRRRLQSADRRGRRELLKKL